MVNNNLCCILNPIRGCKKCEWLICQDCYVSARDKYDRDYYAEHPGESLSVKHSHNIVAQHDVVANHKMHHPLGDIGYSDIDIYN